MFTTIRVAGELWLQRFRALREDRGASTIEYVLLVLLGIAVAGLATIAITAAVNKQDNNLP